MQLINLPTAMHQKNEQMYKTSGCAVLFLSPCERRSSFMHLAAIARHQAAFFSKLSWLELFSPQPAAPISCITAAQTDPARAFQSCPSEWKTVWTAQFVLKLYPTTARTDIPKPEIRESQNFLYLF